MGRSLKVLAWNVDHQVHKRPIPADLGKALAQSQADVLFLSEFVNRDNEEMSRFLDRLDSAGYVFRATAPAPDVYGPGTFYNRIFAASRLPFDTGDIAPPTTNGFATSNFLHLRMHDSDVELVGLRVPLWPSKERSQTALYRKELTSILRSAAVGRTIAVAGDWNRYPFKLIDDLYAVPEPSGSWSRNNERAAPSRLDYVAHTRGVDVREVMYRYEIDGVRLAPKPLSDHAALSFTATQAER